MRVASKRYGCPVELSLDLIGGKWKTLILAWLKEAPHRYGDLRARLPGIADKVLTQRLKELEDAELIERGEIANERSTFYRLSARGESLRPVLEALYAWGLDIASDLSVHLDRDRVGAQQGGD